MFILPSPPIDDEGADDGEVVTGSLSPDKAPQVCFLDGIAGDKAAELVSNEFRAAGANATATVKALSDQAFSMWPEIRPAAIVIVHERSEPFAFDV